MDYKSILLNFILPLIGYGLITGIANLILSRKSQIELWAEAHPKAAAAQKLLRAVGLDPFQIISAISLWSTSKLPDAQRSEGLKASDPKMPKPSNPPSFPMGPMGGMLMLCLVVSLTGCIPGITPKSVDQIAVLLCEDYFAAQHPTLSLHDVERGFCTAAEDVQPFLTEAKKAELRAGARAPKAQRDVTGEGGATQ